MHCWGDENVDWKGIDDSVHYIGRGLVKWGRMSVHQYKEKFGTVRIYMGGLGFHSLKKSFHFYLIGLLYLIINGCIVNYIVTWLKNILI